jgi:7,8-didemethyl-8-hydroxy-5-deazariboflavin synthase CofG subunit
MLCRDQCGYCTFAQPPARLEKIYLLPDDVLSIARQGARRGCHEALFTLGERPEERYEVARAFLREHGYDSTVHYVAAMAKLVLDETGLLPHANCGALYHDELAMLRPVSPSQGMMLESMRDDLECHQAAPDKVPARRLATIEAAGELQIPFTTGILVGIGDDLPGTATSSSAGIVDLVALGFNFNAGADGIVRLEFFEGFNDSEVNPDGIWNSGTLTIQVAAIPEPSTYAMMALGLLAVGGLARRKARG